MSETDNQSAAALVFQLLTRDARTRLMARLPADAIRSLLEQLRQPHDWTTQQIQGVYQQLRQSMEAIRNRPLPIDPISNPPRKLNQKPAIWPRGPVDRPHPFDFLLNCELNQRVRLLEDEHPQHIAVVLSTLPPSVASETMKRLDRNLQVSVLKRLCELDQLDTDQVSELSFALKLRFNRLGSENPVAGREQRSLGLEAATELLRNIDPHSRESVMQELESMSPDTRQRLTKSAIGLDHLLKLSDAQLKRLLTRVDTSLWAPALRRSDLSVRSRVLRAMAPEAAKILSAEISGLAGPDPEAEKNARCQILATIDRLETAVGENRGKAA